MTADLASRIEAHLLALTGWPEGRPVGSPANHAAEAYIAAALEEAGYAVERQAFDCVDWRLESVELWANGAAQPVVGNPYSPAADVTAPVVVAATYDELAAADLSGRIAVLHGALTAEPLFPRNYPFFTVDEHVRLIDLLQARRPAAVVMVSHAADNPAPLIEDGDFALPSVTVAAGVGEALRRTTGPVTLQLRSTRQPGRAANVIGRRAAPARDKLVLCAHFDTKPGTPGALDNAAGVAAVLALAEQLAARPPATNVEIVAFNGEDHYAAPGEMAYITGCGSDFGRITLLINVDGVGLRGQPATVAFFNCPAAWTDQARSLMTRWDGIAESEPWPEGDHSIFAMQGVVCLALTSGSIHALLDGVIHTPADTLDLVDPAGIGAAVEFLAGLLAEVGLPPRAG